MPAVLRQSYNTNAILGASSVSGAPADVTAPTFAGGATLNAVTKTSTTVALTTSVAATDDTAVTGYEWSSDNGVTYPFTSLSNSFTFTALNALTAYNFRVRAYDAAGNRSAHLALTTSTYRAGDTGQNIFDNTGAVGGNPEGFLRNKVTLPADAAKWFSYVITTPPATGTFTTLNPNGTFVFTGPNAETMQVQLEVDGANFETPFTVNLYTAGVVINGEPSTLSLVVTDGVVQSGVSFSGETLVLQSTATDAVLTLAPTVAGEVSVIPAAVSDASATLVVLSTASSVFSVQYPVDPFSVQYPLQ